jgi:hypothetical protein
METEAAQVGVNLAAIGAEHIADATVKLVEGAALVERRLQGLQNAADAVDQRAGAAEVARARGSFLRSQPPEPSILATCRAQRADGKRSAPLLCGA